MVDPKGVVTQAGQPAASVPWYCSRRCRLIALGLCLSPVLLILIWSLAECGFVICPAGGRPLDGGVVAATVWSGRVGRAAAPSPWLDAAHWARRGAAEHASVASFAKYALQLAAAGAPLELLADVSAAQADEVGHAADAYALASALAGAAAAPGPLVAAPLDGGREPRVDVVLDTWRAGCLAETTAADLAGRDVADAAKVDHPLGPRIAAALRRVAEDEARHAALAWKVLAWAAGANSKANATLAGLAAPYADDRLIGPGVALALGAPAPADSGGPLADAIAAAVEAGRKLAAAS